MLRPTCRTFPANDETMEDSALPWGFCVTPLASFPSTRDSRSGRVAHVLPRCRCGAYWSSLALADDDDWVCVLCGKRCHFTESHAGEIISNETSIKLSSDIGHSFVELCSADPCMQQQLRPAFVFLIDGCGSVSFLRTVRACLEYTLVRGGDTALFGLALLNRKSLWLLDARGPSWRTEALRSGSSDSLGSTQISALATDQWLRPCSSNQLKRALDRLESIASYLPKSEYSSLENSDTASAIQMLVGMLERSGVVGSHLTVFLDYNSRTSFDGRSSIAVQVLLDEGPEPEVQWAFRDPEQAPSFSGGQNAFQLGVLIDVHILSSVHILSQTELAISNAIRETGGVIAFHATGDSTMVDKVCERIDQPVVLNGLLRLRTTRGYHVQDAYGACVWQDEDAQDVFHIVAGHGSYSTIYLDLSFNAAAGFQDSPETPCAQLAFRGCWIELGTPVLQILRIHTLTLPTSSSVRAVWKSVDFAAVLAALVYQFVDMLHDKGADAARDWFVGWIIRFVLADTLLTANLRAALQRNTQEEEGERRQIITYHLQHTASAVFGPLNEFIAVILLRLDEAASHSKRLERTSAREGTPLVALSELEALDPDRMQAAVRSWSRIRRGSGIDRDRDAAGPFIPLISEALEKLL